mmetsp:Transcript_2272/g.4680  ORF Transcript_2272/g.4680 Transcript_2272/m.4680 type:complete len:212 (+) Transcript_2272:433-1068(+)
MPMATGVWMHTSLIAFFDSKRCSQCLMTLLSHGTWDVRSPWMPCRWQHGLMERTRRLEMLLARLTGGSATCVATLCSGPEAPLLLRTLCPSPLLRAQIQHVASSTHSSLHPTCECSGKHKPAHFGLCPQTFSCGNRHAKTLPNTSSCGSNMRCSGALIVNAPGRVRHCLRYRRRHRHYCHRPFAFQILGYKESIIQNHSPLRRACRAIGAL